MRLDKSIPLLLPIPYVKFVIKLDHYNSLSLVQVFTSALPLNRVTVTATEQQLSDSAAIKLSTQTNTHTQIYEIRPYADRNFRLFY